MPGVGVQPRSHPVSCHSASVLSDTTIKEANRGQKRKEKKCTDIIINSKVLGLLKSSLPNKWKVQMGDKLRRNTEWMGGETRQINMLSYRTQGAIVRFDENEMDQQEGRGLCGISLEIVTHLLKDRGHSVSALTVFPPFSTPFSTSIRLISFWGWAASVFLSLGHTLVVFRSFIHSLPSAPHAHGLLLHLIPLVSHLSSPVSSFLHSHDKQTIPKPCKKFLKKALHPFSSLNLILIQTVT